MYVSYGTRSTYFFVVYLADLHTTIALVLYDLGPVLDLAYRIT